MSGSRPHGLLAAVIVMALGVPWAAQIAMRSTGKGVAIDWLTRPSPDTAAHALLDVSGAAGLGLLLAALGLWVLSRRSDRDLRRLARNVGSGAVRRSRWQFRSCDRSTSTGT